MGHLDALERQSPTLFTVCGGMLVVYAAFNVLGPLTNVVPEGHGLEAAYVLGFLGLLGLYPSVARRSPWLARFGAAAAGCGIVAVAYVSVNDWVQLAGVTAGNLPGWSVLRLLPLVGFVVGYLSFGAASLRSGAHSRQLGLLLLVPGLIVVLMLVSIVTGHPVIPRLGTVFVVSAGEAMAHLAIGTTLRNDAAAAEDPEAGSEREVVAGE